VVIQRNFCATNIDLHQAVLAGMVLDYVGMVIRLRGRDAMPTFMISMNYTDQGIRNIKDAPKRTQASRDLAKKMGIEVKQIYLTTGDSDLVAIVEAPLGDDIAKFALAIGSVGNVRTRVSRAWPEAEYLKLISELPQRSQK
jgi:uncharacterized protein with GYD domain